MYMKPTVSAADPDQVKNSIKFFRNAASNKDTGLSTELNPQRPGRTNCVKGLCAPECLYVLPST